jgi:tRNA A37 methylthiotransferase MiaB
VRLPGGVPDAVRKERVERLKETDRDKRLEFRSRHLGTVQPVLFENREVDGRMAGHTPNYLDVYAAADVVVAGQIRDVKITDIHPNGVVGDIIESMENVL